MIALTGRMDPQMAAALTTMKELGPPPIADISKAPIDEVRRNYLQGRTYWNADAPELPEVRDLSCPGGNRDIPLRLYRPRMASDLPVLIYAHGGGFIYGNLDSHDKVCRLLALHSGAAVLAVDYALAPEHKFPTPLEEVRRVIAWLDEAGVALGLDLTQVALGGDSAGASISLGVAIELRETRPDYLKQLLLFYGSYGLGIECESARRYGTPEFGLDLDKMAFYRGCYVARPEDHEDPRLKQLAADLRGLPPAYVMAAEMDPLCDNSPALAARLERAGVENTLVIYPGVLHGFLHLSRQVDASAEAIRAAGSALAARFAIAGDAAPEAAAASGD